MKKIFKYLWQKIKQFIINPYWINWRVFLLIIPALGINVLIWFLWIRGYKEIIGAVPVGYSSAVIILNIFLGNLVYRKESLVTYILLSTALLIQPIYLIFLKFLAMSQTF